MPAIPHSLGVLTVHLLSALHNSSKASLGPSPNAQAVLSFGASAVRHYVPLLSSFNKRSNLLLMGFDKYKLLIEGNKELYL